MPDPEKLGPLFQLFKEMTVPPKAARSARAETLRHIQNGVLIALFVAMLLLAILAASRSDSSVPSPGMALATEALAVTIIALALFPVIVLIIEVVRTAWRQRKEYFPAIFDALQKSLPDDACFLARLSRFDKPTLEYGLIQYRHYWSVPDRRLGSLVGDIRKIGLFPGLVAAVAAAITLKKADSDLYLWIPLAVTCAFYLLGFIAVNLRERPEQVIALLEHAIRYADDRPVPAPIVDAAPDRPVHGGASPTEAAVPA